MGSYNHSSCRAYSLYRQILLSTTQLGVCAILTLRLYALYECNKKILLLMCGMALVMVGFAGWVLTGQKSVVSPSVPGIALISGCHLGLSRATALRLAAVWETLFIYDSALFALTLIKTYRTRRRDAVILNLVTLILRDGAIYFALMALATLSNVLSFYFAPIFLRGGLSTFATCASVTMISRLMLNLHESAEEGLPAGTGCK
ncbi:hypothetical protein GYMLUDRAFT_728680 [Collybiopsis luxurians FD-317 M1]|nr:hypothetical protein GYMLUDRAFT_728680 [Collybiopsis luxurians FD-317 M1]